MNVNTTVQSTSQKSSLDFFDDEKPSSPTKNTISNPMDILSGHM